jgi:hypothetical protein
MGLLSEKRLSALNHEKKEIKKSLIAKSIRDGKILVVPPYLCQKASLKAINAGTRCDILLFFRRTAKRNSLEKTASTDLYRKSHTWLKSRFSL